MGSKLPRNLPDVTALGGGRAGIQIHCGRSPACFLATILNVVFIGVAVASWGHLGGSDSGGQGLGSVLLSYPQGFEYVVRLEIRNLVQFYQKETEAWEVG